MDKPTLNRARCRKCGDIITSTHVHHMIWCKCNSIFVDGGNEYQRWGGENLDDVDLSLSKYENR